MGSGLGADEVARSLGMSMSKLSRMENGRRGLYADDVAALLGLYRVSAARREEILDLVRNGRSRNWWQVQDGRLPAMWEDLIRFEREATAIHNYETMLVPGLLQTAEYMRALISDGCRDLNEVEVDLLVAARMGRQEVLTQQTASLYALIEETALRRPIGASGVMRRQVHYLVDSAEQPNITIQLLPLSVGAHLGLAGPLVILEFASQPSLVFLEQRESGAFVEEPGPVATSELAFRRLREAALSPEDSTKLMASIAHELPTDT